MTQRGIVCALQARLMQNRRSAGKSAISSACRRARSGKHRGRQRGMRSDGWHFGRAMGGISLSKQTNARRGNNGLYALST